MSDPSEASATRRVVLASFIGTTIEWYDFFLYGTASALVFGKLFFTQLDPSAATMASFGTFAVGFFARPLGGIVFGHFGDRIGRKSMLVTTLMMMGLATFAIGLLPTYETVGILAPVLLIVLRFIQGLGVGGEWGGAVLMAVEHGKAGQRGFLASWVQAGVPVGLLLATGVFRLLHGSMDEPAFLSWGWRVPFLIGILLLGVGLFIRLHVMESPVFAAAQSTGSKTDEMPILEVLRRYPRNVLLAMGARFGENAFFYVITIFVLTYATEQAAFTKDQVLQAVLIGSAVQFFIVPLFGLWSDKVGRRPLYLAGAVFVVLFAYPFFWLIDQRSAAALIFAVALGLVGHSAMYAPQAAFFSELFATRVRYSGASLGYQLASPLAGGLAPIIATSLLEKSGGKPWPIALYLIGMAAITIISVWLAEETSCKSLEGN